MQPNTIGVKSKYNTNTERRKLICLGSFNNYVDRILPFFNPTPLSGQFLYHERGQKQTFFYSLPPHLVHVVIEWLPGKNTNCKQTKAGKRKRSGKKGYLEIYLLW